MLLCVLSRDATAPLEWPWLQLATSNVLWLAFDLTLQRLVLYLVVTWSSTVLAISDIHLGLALEQFGPENGSLLVSSTSVARGSARSDSWVSLLRFSSLNVRLLG